MTCGKAETPGGLSRAVQRQGGFCMGYVDSSECEAYRAEIECLKKALHSGELTDGNEIAKVQRELVVAISLANHEHSCKIDPETFAETLPEHLMGVLRRNAKNK